MKPDRCIVCNAEATQDAHRASWGPITLYYHPNCSVPYHDVLAPRLRDALVRTLKRWALQGPILRKHTP
jgi:hypothetical protein